MKDTTLTFVEKFFDVEHQRQGGGGFLYIDNLDAGVGCWTGDTLQFMCPCGCGMVGAVAVRNGGWTLTDGSKDVPSLSPSIKMNGPCAWHGYLTGGVFTPC